MWSVESPKEKWGLLATRVAGAMRPIVLQPALIGSALFVALSTVSLAASIHGDKFEGADAKGVRQFLSGEYHVEVLKALSLAAAISALLGLALGVLVQRAVEIRQRWLGRAPLEQASLAWRSLVGLVCVDAFVSIDDIVARPALYQNVLYARGAGLAALQSLLTGYCPRWLLWSVATVLLLVWVALPLTRVADAKRPLRQLAAVLVAVCGLACVAAIPWRRVKPVREHATNTHPNVIVIAADSLRPDYINKIVAPQMTALTEKGVSFDHAYTPLARTFPAWVSMLTGQYPHHHGVRNMFPRWETRRRNYNAIPSSFAAAGYRTAVISDFAGDIFRRIDLGFQRVQTPTFTMRELLRERVLKQTAPLLPWLRGPLARYAIPVLREMSDASDSHELTREALDFIDDAGARPFFLTIFYSNPHFPYAAPAPHYKRFVNEKYRGPYRYAKADTLAAEGALTPEDVAQVRGLFAGAVAAVDSAVSDLVDGLAARQMMNRTVIVITADHGEGLYDSGRGQGHGDHLYGDESLRVPFVVVAPKVEPRRVSTPVSSIDLAPTLCDVAKVSCSKDMDGRSLADFGSHVDTQIPVVFSETGLWFTDSVLEVPFDKRVAYPDLVGLTEVDRTHSDEIVIRAEWQGLTNAAKYRMIRDERYKLIYMPTRQGARFELFDTLADPAEVHDIAKAQPEVVERLKPRLWSWILQDVSLERRGDLVVPRVPRGAGENR